MLKKFKSWKTIASKIFFQSPWTTFKDNEFEQQNGKRGHYYFVSTRGSSMVVPLLSDGRVLLTYQYRYLVDQSSIEFPCGGVKEGHDYEETARHELEEETGYRAGKIEYVGDMVPMNGVTDEISRVYIARDLIKTAQKLDESEEGMEVFAFTQDELEKMIQENRIQDGMTLAAWALVRPRIMN